MKVEAVQLGESLNVKKFIEHNKVKSLAKDPAILEWGTDSHVVLFRYGSVVFWNFNEGQKNDFLSLLMPFVSKPLDTPLTETARWENGNKMSVTNGRIKSKTLDTASRQLIGVSLARTVVLDFFEQKVDELFIHFSAIIDQFTASGRSTVSSKSLLKLVGAAMSINNQTVSQMAMLDKPDFIWDDPELDALFLELEEEYELAARTTILRKKLETLLQDSEFIMNVLDSRRSNFLELIIVSLFVVDIVLILLEKL